MHQVTIVVLVISFWLDFPYVTQGLVPASKTIDSLRPIEETVQAVAHQWPLAETELHTLEPGDRENLGIARPLHRRLAAFRRNHDCGQCWLQKAHCICAQCPPLEYNSDQNDDDDDDYNNNNKKRDEDDSNQQTLASLTRQTNTTNGTTLFIRRMFVLTHHKEICLAVDTAKLVALAFPQSCQIVVGGISPTFQASMKKMMECIQTDPTSTLVLFPSEQAQIYQDIDEQVQSGKLSVPVDGWNLIVIDGTWEQATKLYRRYLAHSDKLVHVKLSQTSLQSILVQSQNEEADKSFDKALDKSNHALQLRRHPELWRQISTLAALRYLLTEMAPHQTEKYWQSLAIHQQIADAAARKQLGPIRMRQPNESVPQNFCQN